MELKTEKRGRLEMLTHEGVTWVNLEKPTPEDISVLGQQYPFHALNLEDCVSKVQLTKIDEHEGYMFVVLHFPTLTSRPGVIQSCQISIFLGSNYLVTVHQGDLKPVAGMFQACKTDLHQREALMGKGSAYLLYRIVDALVDDLFPRLDELLRDLDEIEDRVFDEKIDAIHEVTILRREIGDLRRVIFPLRGVATELAMKSQVFSTHDLSAFFSDVKDHIEKAWGTLEEAKETIDIFKDTDFMLNTERTNNILAVLTIVFTLSIPVTLLGTFYGMNVNLPGGVETGPWTILGPYTTLLVVTLASVIPTVLMLWVFRRNGWI